MQSDDVENLSIADRRRTIKGMLSTIESYARECLPPESFDELVDDVKSELAVWGTVEALLAELSRDDLRSGGKRCERNVMKRGLALLFQAERALRQTNVPTADFFLAQFNQNWTPQQARKDTQAYRQSKIERLSKAARAKVTKKDSYRHTLIKKMDGDKKPPGGWKSGLDVATVLWDDIFPSAEKVFEKHKSGHEAGAIAWIAGQIDKNPLVKAAYLQNKRAVTPRVARRAPPT